MGRVRILTQMLTWNEAIDRLAMVNGVHEYGHVLRREDGHVLRREDGHVLKKESEDVAEGQRKKGRLKGTQKKQV